MNRAASCLAIGIAAVSLSSALFAMPTLLIWNASASLPTGLYRITAAPVLERGERVVIDPPPRLRRFLARRGYLPAGVPLIKDIAGLAGDRVCRRGRDITIDGVEIARALGADRRGRTLPVWHGCHLLAAGEIFLLNRRVRDSFDGRYFGILTRSEIVGRAIPVWTDEAGDGVHVWFASGKDGPASTPSAKGDAR